MIPISATTVAALAVHWWLAATPPPLPQITPILPPGALAVETPLAPPAPAPFRVAAVAIARGSSLSQLLKGTFAMLKDERAALMDSLKPFTDPAKITAGTEVRGTYSGPEDELPSQIELKVAPTRTLVARRFGKDQWATSAREAKVERRVVAYAGVVRSTLWGSATDAGMDPQLISGLTDIFACQMDFNRRVQENDRWRLTVERRFVDGKPVGFGDIIAAQYDTGAELMSAVRYVGEGGRVEYFAPNGDSLQALFLKSPLRYGHVTSGFSARRFHPILKINRPHLGVDYGAPTGTPILAVGDGTITFAANRGGSGKMISLKHNATYTTQYKHMSAFAKGIVPGAKVAMGQVIGYVGATGLATGPHLHFEFHIGNKVVDPLGVKFPKADPVPAKHRDEFQKAAAKALADLPAWSHGTLSAGLRKDDGVAE